MPYEMTRPKLAPPAPLELSMGGVPLGAPQDSPRDPAINGRIERPLLNFFTCLLNAKFFEAGREAGRHVTAATRPALLARRVYGWTRNAIEPKQRIPQRTLYSVNARSCGGRELSPIGSACSVGGNGEHLHKLFGFHFCIPHVSAKSGAK